MEFNPIGADSPGVRLTRTIKPEEAVMRRTAQEFEAVFLTEMLKHAGVGRMTEGFNGGPGEAAFTDMLTQEYAREISRSGGFGLADQILIGMKEAGK